MDTDGWKWGCVFLCTHLIMRWISHLASSSRRGERLLTLKKNYSPFRSHVYAFSQNSMLSAQTWSRAWSRFWNPGAKSTMSMCRLHIKQHFRASAIFHSFVSVIWRMCSSTVLHLLYSGNSGVLGLPVHRWVHLKCECWWEPVRGVIRHSSGSAQTEGTETRWERKKKLDISSAESHSSWQMVDLIFGNDVFSVCRQLYFCLLLSHGWLWK